MRVGFVGLGAMGLPMTRHLVSAGHDVTVSSRGRGPIDTAVCDPANAATHSECGTVYIGLTDADGDFVNYTVDVVQLTLETADGRTVDTLPCRGLLRVDR